MEIYELNGELTKKLPLNSQYNIIGRQTQMTMQEFVAATNKAAEIYKGEIIALNNDLDGNLHVLLSQKNFDALDIEVTAAYPCNHPDCRGDWEVEKQVGNIVFTIYHRGAYNRQEVA